MLKKLNTIVLTYKNMEKITAFVFWFENLASVLELDGFFIFIFFSRTDVAHLWNVETLTKKKKRTLLDFPVREYKSIRTSQTVLLLHITASVQRVIQEFKRILVLTSLIKYRILGNICAVTGKSVISVNAGIYKCSGTVSLLFTHKEMVSCWG